MITFRVSADIQDHHCIGLTLPPEVPNVQAELVITVSSEVGKPDRRPRTSLVDWAEEKSEHWGNRLDSSDVEGFTGRRF